MNSPQLFENSTVAEMIVISAKRHFYQNILTFEKHHTS